MSEVESVTELDPRDGARRAEPSRKLLSLLLCLSEITDDGLETEEQPALGQSVGMLFEMCLEQENGLTVPALFGQ